MNTFALLVFAADRYERIDTSIATLRQQLLRVST